MSILRSHAYRVSILGVRGADSPEKSVGLPWLEDGQGGANIAVRGD